MMSGHELIICSNIPGKPFAQAVAERIDAKYVELRDEAFSDGEPDYRVMAHIRGTDTFYICPYYPDPMARKAETTLVGDALKYSSPERLVFVPTYMGFMKKDWKDEPHVPISIRTVAIDFETYADRVLTMDMHSRQIQGMFRIPLDHLEARRTFKKHFERMGYSKDDTMVVAPDIGAVKRAHGVSELTELPLAVVYEIRDPRTREKKAHGILGDVRGKRVVLIDDQAVSLETLVEAAQILKDEGRAGEVVAFVTHGLMTEKEGVTAESRLEKSDALKKLYVTDTIWRDPSYFSQNPKIDTVSVVDEFAEAIRRIHNNESLSELFG